jgi:hypothetical protein
MSGTLYLALVRTVLVAEFRKWIRPILLVMNRVFESQSVRDCGFRLPVPALSLAPPKAPTKQSFVKVFQKIVHKDLTVELVESHVNSREAFSNKVDKAETFSFY